VLSPLLLLLEKSESRAVLSARRRRGGSGDPRLAWGFPLQPAALLVSPCERRKGLESVGKREGRATGSVHPHELSGRRWRLQDARKVRWKRDSPAAGQDLPSQKASFTFLLLYKVVTVQQLYTALQERRHILTLF